MNINSSDQRRLDGTTCYAQSRWPADLKETFVLTTQKLILAGSDTYIL